MTATDRLVADSLALIRRTADFARWAADPPRDAGLAPVAEGIVQLAHSLHAASVEADAERLHRAPEPPLTPAASCSVPGRAGERFRRLCSRKHR